MSATVNLKLWKYRAKKDGSYPIYIRITKNRKSSWQSINVNVKEKEWDEQKGKVKACHPNSARLNAQLSEIQLRYQTEILDAENGQLSIGLKSIKKKMTGSDEKIFLLAANELNNSYKVEGKIASYDKVNSILKKLVEFMNCSDFTFQDIDLRLLLNYQNYLIEVKNNKPSSINRDLKFIKTVYLYAQRMEYIPLTVNPFLNFRF